MQRRGPGRTAGRRGRRQRPSRRERAPRGPKARPRCSASASVKVVPTTPRMSYALKIVAFTSTPAPPSFRSAIVGSPFRSDRIAASAAQRPGTTCPKTASRIRCDDHNEGHGTSLRHRTRRRRRLPRPARPRRPARRPALRRRHVDRCLLPPRLPRPARAAAPRTAASSKPPPRPRPRRSRPCLKCRPDCPRSGVRVVGDGRLAHPRPAGGRLACRSRPKDVTRRPTNRAPSVAAVALRLGVSDRHLRRIFAADGV